MWSSGVAEADLSQVFRAAQLSTRLSDAQTVHLQEPTVDAYERLVAGRFDQAPVERDGKYVGWVLTAALRNSPRVKAVLRPLNQCTILTGDSPLKDLLTILNSEQLVFLAGHRGLEAFVTTSDLDRHAARGHFYLLISGVEMLLADLVNAMVDPPLVEAAIGEAQLGRWEEAQAGSAEARPVEYLDLRQLAELFSAAVEGDQRWGKQYDDMLTALCHLRPTVMHATRPLLAGRQPAQLARLADAAAEITTQLRQFMQRL